MARTSNTTQLIDRIEASEVARHRVKVVLLTMGGHWPVSEACEHLGLGRTRFQDLRRRMLVGMVQALEPAPRGRPTKVSNRVAPEVRSLQAEIEELRLNLRISQASLDLARGPAAHAVAQRLGAVASKHKGGAR